jgi:hypothetical protein
MDIIYVCKFCKKKRINLPALESPSSWGVLDVCKHSAWWQVGATTPFVHSQQGLGYSKDTITISINGSCWDVDETRSVRFLTHKI